MDAAAPLPTGRKRTESGPQPVLSSVAPVLRDRYPQEDGLRAPVWRFSAVTFLFVGLLSRSGGTMSQALIMEPGPVDAEFLEIVAGLGGFAGTEPAPFRAKTKPFEEDTPSREDGIEPWEDEEPVEDDGLDWP